MKRTLVGLAILPALLAPSAALGQSSAPPPNSPPSSVAAAHQAYDKGVAAFAAGRYGEAAVELARADALAPHPTALRNALKAAELAGDPVLAMTLVERAEARVGVDASVLDLARRLRGKHAAHTGKLSIRCAAVGCTVTLDAEPFPIEQQRWVQTGAHAVEITRGGARSKHTVVVEAEQVVAWVEPTSVAVAPPAAVRVDPPRVEPVRAPPAPEPRARGISPWWFAAGAGLTAAATGALIASGVDTLVKQRDYQAFETNDLSSGQSAQLRTNVLVGVTAVLGLSTAAIGVFAVRWSPSTSSARRPREITVTPGVAGATLRASF